MKTDLLFNLACALVMLIVLDVVRQRHRRSLLMAYRFKVFAFRDRLARLVVDDSLPETSRVYRFLLGCFNYYIKNTARVDLLVFIKAHLHLQQDAAYRRELKSVLRECSQSHPEVLAIMLDFERATLTFVVDRSFVLKRLMPPGIAICKQIRWLYRWIGHDAVRVQSVLDAQSQRVAYMERAGMSPA